MDEAFLKKKIEFIKSLLVISAESKRRKVDLLAFYEAQLKAIVK